MTGLRLHLVALERLHQEVDVVGRERVLLAVDRNAHLGPGLELLGDTADLERLDGGRHLGHLLTEPRTERPVVGPDPVGDQLRFGVNEVELLDVELRGDDVESLDRRRSVSEATTTALRKWLAQLHLCLRPGRAAEFDRAPHRVHALLELPDERLVHLEVAEVDRVRVLARPLSAGCSSAVSSPKSRFA